MKDSPNEFQQVCIKKKDHASFIFWEHFSDKTLKKSYGSKYISLMILNNNKNKKKVFVEKKMMVSNNIRTISITYVVKNKTNSSK